MGASNIVKNLAHDSKYIAICHHLEDGATPNEELVSPGTRRRKLICECRCKPPPGEPEGP